MEVDQYRSRKITGPRLLQVTDGVLDDQMLSEEGDRFTAAYYARDEDGYVSDYLATFPEAETIYHVEDSAANFAAIGEKLSQRYAAWKKMKR